MLVIIFAVFGIWYATSFWQPALDTWATGLPTAKAIDWVETISGWGETAIQILLGATSTR